MIYLSNLVPPFFYLRARLLESVFISFWFIVKRVKGTDGPVTPVSWRFPEDTETVELILHPQM